jgi:ribosomal protein L11 methyltransferase
MKNTIRLFIAITSQQQSELIISALSDTNFYAFEESDDHLMAYISEEDFHEALAKAALAPYSKSYKKEVIPFKNWNLAWEQNYEPVVIDDFVSIRASFHQPITGVQHDIIITPKMSFGTGHHATTYLMANAMKKIEFNNKTVLDFGTGTAILAILAEKLGAASITAIDNDEWSITNASENVATNDSNKITLLKADTLNVETQFDIILCNINLNVVIQNAEKIINACKSNAVILLSGFLVEDEAAIEKAFNGKSVIQTVKVNRDGWLLLAYEQIIG